MSVRLRPGGLPRLSLGKDRTAFYHFRQIAFFRHFTRHWGLHCFSPTPLFSTSGFATLPAGCGLAYLAAGAGTVPGALRMPPRFGFLRSFRFFPNPHPDRSPIYSCRFSHAFAANSPYSFVKHTGTGCATSIAEILKIDPYSSRDGSEFT